MTPLWHQMPSVSHGVPWPPTGASEVWKQDMRWEANLGTKENVIPKEGLKKAGSLFH